MSGEAGSVFFLHSMPHVIGLALFVCMVKQYGAACLKSGFFIRRIDFLCAFKKVFQFLGAISYLINLILMMLKCLLLLDIVPISHVVK